MESADAPPWNCVMFEKKNKILPFLTDFGTWEYEFNSKQKELEDLRNNITKYEDNSGRWEYFKKVVNPYECIFTQKKYDNFPESVSLLNPLSRSYFKLIEILNVVRFFDNIRPCTILRSAHACEGPGGFIEAFIDLSEKKKLNLAQAIAITLRPRQPNVPGWKRAANFLSKHTNITINYGADNTGDLLKEANQKAFIQACERKVHLYTADGGFDFSTNYSQQERNIFPLLIASTRVGFEVLREGGTFILKFFDIYHEGMRDLIYFLSCYFKSWTLYKPATSRPCNPEQYFIGTGYRVCTGQELIQLQSWCVLCDIGTVPRRLFGGDLPVQFCRNINNIIAKVVDLQLYYLKQVFSFIENSDKKKVDTEVKELLKHHQIRSYDWCKVFNVPVYPARHRSIEVLQNDLRASGQL